METASAEWEASGIALGSAPKGALGHRGASEGAQGNWAAPGSTPESAQCGPSTGRALIQHSLQHPQLP